jgi:hypothetical protein
VEVVVLVEALVPYMSPTKTSKTSRSIFPRSFNHFPPIPSLSFDISYSDLCLDHTDRARLSSSPSKPDLAFLRFKFSSSSSLFLLLDPILFFLTIQDLITLSWISWGIGPPRWPNQPTKPIYSTADPRRENRSLKKRRKWEEKKVSARRLLQYLRD